MNDTSPWAAERMAALMAERTPGERVAMACEMFSAARALAIAGIRAEHPGIGEQELKMLLLERTYRGDFGAEEWARIVERMRRAMGAAERNGAGA